MSGVEDFDTDSLGFKDDDRPDSGLYRACMAYYLHQDRLLWSRTQLLVALQAAVIAAGFTLRGQWGAPALMALGATLTVLILILMVIDQRARDLNLPLMDMLVDRLAPMQIKEELRSMGQKYVFRFTTTWFNRFPFIRGSRVIWLVMILFICIDVALAVLYAWPTHIFA